MLLLCSLTAEIDKGTFFSECYSRVDLLLPKMIEVLQLSMLIPDSLYPALSSGVLRRLFLPRRALIRAQTTAKRFQD